LVQQEAAKYPNAELLWVQEEHKNMGAWTYVQPRINNLLKKEIKYAGRHTAASPATGSKHQHLKEQAQLYEDAFA
jgi:2-oxoglutarate dehydrogenase E1 component